MLKLPRLPQNLKLVDSEGRATIVFTQYWQQFATAIEDSVNGIQAALDAAQVAKTAADTAQQAANSAQAAAQAAGEGGAVNAAESSIVNSFVTGYTPPLISADSAGAVTIANHQRQYGDTALNPTVAVTGAVIATGAAPGQTVRVYYDDPSRAGGAVTYQFTIDPAAQPVQGGDRHSVGAVKIPAAGTQAGQGLNPPGYVFLN